jgi:hypothetical protein
VNKKNKLFTPEEIECAIYGDGGYYDRVVSAMNADLQGSIKKTGATRQMLLIFRTLKKNGEFKYKPKLETIEKYAKALGVE